MSEILKNKELQQALKKCPEWDVQDDEKEIYRTVEFEEFMEAMDCVNMVADLAEEANHHPDIDIRWLKVTFRLTTHESGGVTLSDVEMASRIDNLLD